MNSITIDESFKQVCVWPCTVVGENNISDFEKFMKDEFNVNVKYLEEIPICEDRIDLFFKIHNDDIGKFALKRLSYGIRWVEDVLDPINYTEKIYPERVFKYRSWS